MVFRPAKETCEQPKRKISLCDKMLARPVLSFLILIFISVAEAQESDNGPVCMPNREFPMGCKTCYCNDNGDNFICDESKCETVQPQANNDNNEVFPTKVDSKPEMDSSLRSYLKNLWKKFKSKLRTFFEAIKDEDIKFVATSIHEIASKYRAYQERLKTGDLTNNIRRKRSIIQPWKRRGRFPNNLPVSVEKREVIPFEVMQSGDDLLIRPADAPEKQKRQTGEAGNEDPNEEERDLIPFEVLQTGDDLLVRPADVPTKYKRESYVELPGDESPVMVIDNYDDLNKLRMSIAERRKKRQVRIDNDGLNHFPANAGDNEPPVIIDYEDPRQTRNERGAEM